MTTYFIGDTPVDSEESFYAAMRDEDLYLDLQESAQAFRVEIL